MTFAHLHVHSYYSLLDGIDSPEKLVEAAAANGQPAIAITDHGTLSGVRELYRAGKEHGVKPIFGLEAYISATDRYDRRNKKNRDDDTDVYNHIILLAKSQKGFENISELSSHGWHEGFYFKPRIDMEILERYSRDLIVLTGCLSGIASKAIEYDRPELAEKWLDKLYQLFEDDMYVEVQAHNPEKINKTLIQIADREGYNIVATSDAHRAYKSDADLQDAFLAISTKPKAVKGKNYANTTDAGLMEKLDELYPDRPMTFRDYNLYIQSREEIEEDFRDAGFHRDEFFDNTLEIADKIGDYEYYEGEELLPVGVEDPDEELTSRCVYAAHNRGLTDPKYTERLTMELEVIKKKHFSPYFIIVQDMVQYARENGILVGPGRGSAAGSLVCYLLGITDVDPLEYDLLFARFINEERNDFPDIDLDFPRSRRGEIKRYLEQRYGNVASIATFNYFKDKNAIKDAARVLGVPYNEVEDMARNIETMHGYFNSKNKVVTQFRAKYPEVGRLAQRLQGRIRGAGMHAGGVVVSGSPISQYAPIETNKDPLEDDLRVDVVAYDMDEVADIGLIKFDILGLKTLDVIQDALDLAELTYEDLQDIDLNDSRIYEELSKGNTVGVFQCDTNPYTNLLVEMQPENFEDLAASNALIRPGAMNTVGGQFLRRRSGEEAVEYVDESVEDILENTFGTIIYQEQVMQTAVQLGQMNWAQADRLRKIIGKKKDPAEFAAYKDAFMDGATQSITQKEANKLWHDFEAHAGYSFNRSHAIAYSMLSVWTMWLKVNYPVEFVTALLRNEDNKNKITDYFIEAERLGIEVMLPDIHKSDSNFRIEGENIRFGLANMKYISEKVFRNIDKKRPFKNYDSFLKICDKKYSGINKRAIEALEWTGALESIGGPKHKKGKLYDYLALPTFKVPELADHVEITKTEDFHSKGTYLMAGMVKNIKRSPDPKKNWALIDMVDDTGSVGFFHNRDTNIEKGGYYYLIVSNNRIKAYVSADDFEEQPDHPFVQYLSNSMDSLLDERSRYVIQCKGRKTRAGKSMADIFVADRDGVLEEYVVFPNKYNVIFSKVRAGQQHDFKITKTRRGSYAVEAAR